MELDKIHFQSEKRIYTSGVPIIVPTTRKRESCLKDRHGNGARTHGVRPDFDGENPS